MKKVLIIDNYDSFTYNIAQRVGKLKGVVIEVFRNDKITVDEVIQKKFDRIIISPGPRRPKDAGISNELILKLGREIPILGICLGHQCIAEVFGAKIVKSNKIFHGKTSEIYTDGKSIYCDIPKKFTATRYHSLIVSKSKFPSILEISAKTKEGLIMGIRHRNYPIEGTQFHPESILTDLGEKILSNFIYGEFSNNLFCKE